MPLASPPAPAGLIFRTSLSPTFSCFMPGLTQVLTPQTDLPHGSTRIWVLPSARAQAPRYDGSRAGAALTAPIILKPSLRAGDATFKRIGTARYVF